jgi:PKD repeat protein
MKVMYGFFARKTIRWALTIAVMMVMLLVLLGSASCSNAPAPTAAFTAEVTVGDLITDKPITGLAPLTVRFTDKSTGEITAWRWNFGDGSAIVYEQNPSHTYTQAGRSTVQLSVEGPGGSDPEVKTFFVNILTISEAANNELNQARQAVLDCMSKAGTGQLDAAVLSWDGSAGEVTAGNGAKDAADYLIKKPFKATYDVALDGTIYSGDPGTWDSGIVWDTSTDPDRWRAVGDL